MQKKLRQRGLGLAVATVVATLTLLIGFASPAGAWTGGNVWVNFSSKAMCTRGGSITRIYWAVENYSVGPANGDRGDNVIYPRVRVGSGAYNTLSFSLWCTRLGITYKAGDGQKRLSPYKSGLSYTYYTYF